METAAAARSEQRVPSKDVETPVSDGHVVAVGRSKTDVRLDDSFVGIGVADGDIRADDSFIAAGVAGGDIELEDGGATALIAGQNMHLTNGGAGLIAAGQNMQIENGGAGFLIAGQNMAVQNSQDQRSILVAGREVEIDNGSFGAVCALNADVAGDGKVLIELSPRKAVEAAVKIAALPIASAVVLAKMIRRDDGGEATPGVE